jgi:hypothetical protein
MAVLDMLTKAKKAKPGSSLENKLAELIIDDSAVVRARQAEAEILEAIESSGVTLTRTKAAHASIEGQLRRALSDGIDGTQLRSARDASALNLENEVARAEGLGEKLLLARQQVRDAETEAAKKNRTELVKLAATNTADRDALFAQLERLTADSLLIRNALERACPLTPITTSYGLTTGHSRPDFKSGWEVVLGLVETNPLTLMQRAFTRDPRADGGGLLGTWRVVAKQSGLLPDDVADPGREQRQKRQEEAARRKEASDHARIDSVWGAEDKRTTTLGWK